MGQGVLSYSRFYLSVRELCTCFCLASSPSLRLPTYSSASTRAGLSLALLKLDGGLLSTNMAARASSPCSIGAVVRDKFQRRGIWAGLQG